MFCKAWTTEDCERRIEKKGNHRNYSKSDGDGMAASVALFTRSEGRAVDNRAKKNGTLMLAMRSSHAHGYAARRDPQRQPIMNPFGGVELK